MPVDTIQNLHPGKFDAEKIQDYIGAVFDEKNKNQKAIELEKYYEFVITNPAEEVFAKPVEFAIYEKVNNIFEDVEELASSDMIIYNMTKVNKDTINNILNLVLGGDKTFHAALLLFHSELDYFEIITFLRSQHAVTSMINNFKILPLLFNKVLNSRISNTIVENIQYGLLLGKFIVLKSPLMVHYSDPAQIIKVVEAICPPQGRIGLVSDPGLVPIQLHNQDLEWNVRYYGTEGDLEKFKKKLAADKTPVVSLNDEEDTELDESEEEVSENEDVPSTSTTPVKPSNEKSSLVISTTSTENTSIIGKLDDSGFLESTPQSSRGGSRSLDFGLDVSLIDSEI